MSQPPREALFISSVEFLAPLTPSPCRCSCRLASTEFQGTSPTHLSSCLCQGSDISSSTFADGELLLREPGFFQEDEEEAMTLALPEGPQELDMDSPMESSQGPEGSVMSSGEEKEPELGALFLPEDK